jgi:hypothetical protein
VIVDLGQWRRNSPDEIAGTSSSRPNIPGISANNADPKVLIKHLKTREVLLSVLPAAELLGAILNVTCSWWDTWCVIQITVHNNSDSRNLH